MCLSRHASSSPLHLIYLRINNMRFGHPPAFFPSQAEETHMEFLLNLLTIATGMALSLSVAVLVEELIFGKVFPMVFARQAVRIKSAQR